MYTFWECGNVRISIKHFALGIPFMYPALHVCLATLSGTKDLLVSLYMMSSRSWHMYNNFPTAVLYTARAFVIQLDQRLRRWCSLDSSPKNGNHVSDVLRICFDGVSTSFCHDHDAKKEYLIVQSSQSSHNAHQDLIRQVLD